MKKILGITAAAMLGALSFAATPTADAAVSYYGGDGGWGRPVVYMGAGYNPWYYNRVVYPGAYYNRAMYPRYNRVVVYPRYYNRAAYPRYYNRAMYPRYYNRANYRPYHYGYPHYYRWNYNR